jgi:hypothetical protein
MADFPENAGVDFRVEDHVYTFTEVVFLLDDPNGEALYYPVASINMKLSLNQLPMANVVVAPQSFTEEDAIDAETDNFIFVAQPEPLRPTLADFVAEYRKLQKLVLTDGIKASLLLTMERSDNNETQQINIEEWIPTEVTINSTEQSGSFLLAVTIMHPAYLAASAVGWLPNSAATLNPPEEFTPLEGEPATDIPGIFIGVNKIYIEKGKEAITGLGPEGEGAAETQSSIECATDLESLSETAFERLDSALDAFLQYIQWEALGGSDLPFGGDLIDTASSEEEYFGRLMWQVAGRQDSPWLTFVSMTGEYDLVISGAPTDNKLLITPFVPWGKWSMRLFDSEIYANQMPGLGQREVSGVLSAYAAGAENDWDTSYYEALDNGQSMSNTPQLNTFGGYVCPLTEEPFLLGPIAYRDPPSYLREYLLDQSGNFGPNSESNPMGRNEANFDTFSAYDQEQVPPDLEQGSSSGEAPVGYEELINRWSRQAFFRLYKSDDAIAVNTRLLIQSPSANTPGRYVRPGIVVKISSVVYPDDSIQSPGLAEEEPVLYFYVTGVTHEISPGARTATTTLTGTYLRFAEAIEQAGITADQIENGIENPIYNSLGEYTTAVAFQ